MNGLNRYSQLLSPPLSLSQACVLRVIANGGRASETLGTGPDGFGAVVLGARSLSEVGTVGSWPREQTEAFCVSNLIHCMLDADDENIIMDLHFAVGVHTTMNM